MNGGPLRLAFVAPGNSIHTQRWVGHFARHGHEVGLVAYGRVAETIAGVDVLLELDAFSESGGARRVIDLPRAAVRVRRAVRRFAPDLVAAHFLTGPAWLAATAAGRAPLVVTAWGSDVLVDGRHVGIRLLHRLALRRAAYATCDAEQVGDGLVALGVPAERVRRTQWGVDVRLFTPGEPDSTLHRELHLPSGKPIVLAVRGLRDLQNPLTIVRAFAAVRATGREAALALKLGPADAGVPGQVAAELRRLALDKDTVVIGHLAHRRLADLYRAADVCLTVPSSDGTSVALLEAMATARPVVATDIPANREWIVDRRHGVLVPPGDEAALADAIAWILDEPVRAKALGDAARARVAVDADERVTMSQVEQIYRSAVESSTA